MIDATTDAIAGVRLDGRMSSRTRPPETSLYEAVKAFLEGCGFAVKGKVCGCNIVAVRPGEPPARADRAQDGAHPGAGAARGRAVAGRGVGPTG